MTGPPDMPANPEAIYREALRMAEIRLMQSEEQPRWDCAARLCVSDAADLLRKAGHGDLADRLDEDVWAGDTLSVLEAIRMRVCPVFRGPAITGSAKP